MSEPLPVVTLPKEAVDREVYLAVAATSSPETDVLADIVRHLLLLQPNIETLAVKQASEAIAAPAPARSGPRPVPRPRFPNEPHPRRGRAASDRCRPA